MKISPEFNERMRSIDDTFALTEFSDLLIEMSRALAPENEYKESYFLTISPTLERLTTYNYENFIKDAKDGTIPKEEMFLYKAMSILRKRVNGFEAYKKNLADINTHFRSLNGRTPDREALQKYRNMLQEFAQKATELYT